MTVQRQSQALALFLLIETQRLSGINQANKSLPYSPTGTKIPAKPLIVFTLANSTGLSHDNTFSLQFWRQVLHEFSRQWHVAKPVKAAHVSTCKLQPSQCGL